MTEQAETTAVKVNPGADTVVKAFYEEALNLELSATDRIILSLADMAAATETLTMIQALKRAMEGKRKEYVSPLQNHVKAVNDTFKGLMEPVEEADRILRGKMLAFQEAEMKKRIEQERINRLRREAAEAEAALKDEPVEPVELIKPDLPLPSRVVTEGGTTGTRTIRKWRVLDIRQVPAEYLIVDNGRVTKAVKAGIGAIPGIEIYEEKVLTVEARGA